MYFVVKFSEHISNLSSGIMNSGFWILQQQSHAPVSLVSAQNQSTLINRMIEMYISNAFYQISIQIDWWIDVTGNAIQIGSLDWCSCVIHWNFIRIDWHSDNAEKITRR